MAMTSTITLTHSHTHLLHFAAPSGQKVFYLHQHREHIFRIKFTDCEARSTTLTSSNREPTFAVISRIGTLMGELAFCMSEHVIRSTFLFQKTFRTWQKYINHLGSISGRL